MAGRSVSDGFEVRRVFSEARLAKSGWLLEAVGSQRSMVGVRLLAVAIFASIISLVIQSLVIQSMAVRFGR